MADQHRDRAAGLKRHHGRSEYGFSNHRTVVYVLHHDADVVEHTRRALAHRQLPRVEFAPFAAHRHQHQQRKAALTDGAQHVDAVAHAGGLHQQRAAIAAQPRAREHGHTFFLGGEGNCTHRFIGVAVFDQGRVAGVRHVGNLADADLFEYFIDVQRPGW